jgi:hypothetical protein
MVGLLTDRGKNTLSALADPTRRAIHARLARGEAGAFRPQFRREAFARVRPRQSSFAGAKRTVIEAEA